MTLPINLYTVSKLQDETIFNTIVSQKSQAKFKTNSRIHEIEYLKIFVDLLLKNGISIELLDDFYFGFKIPQIGKEFDILKFSNNSCLNIELKSQAVEKSRILKQLQINYHYLKHLGKKLNIFSVNTESMEFVKLSDDNKLVDTDITDIIDEIKRHENSSFDIDELFKANKYLVSPLNTPQKFLLGEYYLTQQQEEFKRLILEDISSTKLHPFFHITGNPGTGKTLLLYDLAVELSKADKTLIIHCGICPPEIKTISDNVDNLEIIPASRLRNADFELSNYRYILVDESHRIHLEHFHFILDKITPHENICIFSSDANQVLSEIEIKSDVVGKIKKLSEIAELNLSNKIRMSDELNSFVNKLFDLKRIKETSFKYSNVDLCFASDIDETKKLIEYFRNKGYIFINYTKSNKSFSPFSNFNEDFDNHHVIGQEFDKVLMLMGPSFYYDDNMCLQAKPHPDPNYLYRNLLFQGLTRAREKIAIIVIDNMELMNNIAKILESE